MVYFDPLSDDSIINVGLGKPHANDLRKIHDLVLEANKKLFIPHEYDWIVDRGVKLTGIKPYTLPVIPANAGIYTNKQSFSTNKWIPFRRTSDQVRDDIKKSTVKIFLDLSNGLVVDKEADGVFIASEKIFDLNKSRDSFENLVFKLVESSLSFPHSPILLKLADISEGMGKVRGSLRLLHQKSLFDPMIQALERRVSERHN